MLKSIFNFVAGAIGVLIYLVVSIIGAAIFYWCVLVAMGFIGELLF